MRKLPSRVLRRFDGPKLVHGVRRRVILRYNGSDGGHRDMHRGSILGSFGLGVHELQRG